MAKTQKSFQRPKMSLKWSQNKELCFKSSSFFVMWYVNNNYTKVF